MKVAIVGANSQVGSELALLLRTEGHDVRPVVRNRIATAFLDHAGFDCIVHDISDGPLRDEYADDLDVVVVAAFAPYGIGPRRSRRTNERIVEHSVRSAPKDATVVYFSSIAAFGSEIKPDESRIGSYLDTYTREKRYVESAFEDACREGNRSGYSFRLGHVFGDLQGKTDKIAGRFDGRATLKVNVSPDRPSNVLHTVTLLDAIETCVENDVTEGQYTVVNDPQWTWGDVFEHYLPETTVEYVDAGSESFVTDLKASLWSLGRSYKQVINPLRVFFPERVNDRIGLVRTKNAVASEIDRYEESAAFDTHEFAYRPAPGPTLPGIPETQSRLADVRIDDGDKYDEWNGKQDPRTT